MSHRALLVWAIKDSLSEIALNYFVNTTEKDQWIDYAEEHGIAKAISALEDYSECFANGEKEDA